MSNTNGNITLFLSTMFAAMAPGYKLAGSSTFALFFYFIPVFYSILFFFEHLNAEQKQKVKMHSKNDNETHYSALALGLFLGTAIKFRLGLRI